MYILSYREKLDYLHGSELRTQNIQEHADTSVKVTYTASYTGTNS